MALNLNIPKPSVSEVQKYLDEWQTLENYPVQESALNKLFFELTPKNTDINDVLLKSATLNDFYSTNIFSIYSVAKHIMAIQNLDERLTSGDVTLVNELKKVIIQDKEKNFYSFATKYCSHHNPLDFPIYDSYVEKILMYFNKTYRFSNFKKNELKDYPKFKRILLDFQSFFELQEFNLKQLDQYLWLLGKYTFSKNKEDKDKALN